MATDREERVFMAKLAEQAERYEEMKEYMKELADAMELSPEERNLFSAAYKNVVGSRRASWRIISSVEQKEEGRGNSDNLKRIKEYREKVETELSKICDEILDILSRSLIPKSTSTEGKVFYLKMKGDYYRYLAEYRVGADRKAAAQNAMDAYKEASDLASKDLNPMHPTRLGLALNFSVFYYEIMGSPEEACNLARKAFDEAIAELEKMPESEASHKDSTLIMQLLRDNLSLWAADLHDDKGEEEAH